MKYALGIDVGGTSIKCGLVNEKGEVVDTSFFDVDKTKKGEDIINEICAEIKKAHKNEKKVKISGIGIGIPGLLDIESGVVISSPNLPLWNDFHIVELFEKISGFKTKIVNDAKAAALGEAIYGSGKNYNCSVMITLGTGVGGGVVYNKKVFYGNKGQGTELGHMVLIPDGEECGCGRKGCFEQYASATALIRQTKAAMNKSKDSMMWNIVEGNINKVDGRTAFQAEALGDKDAKEVIKQYVSYLGDGLLNYCNIFRPEVFILSGGIAKEGENLLSRLRTYLRENDYGFKKSLPVDIKVATVGYQSGIIGAASLIFFDD